MKTLKTLILLFTLFFSNYASAALPVGTTGTGCYVASTGIIYPNYSDNGGTYYPDTYYNTDPTEYSRNCDGRGNNITAIRRGNSSNSSCRVRLTSGNNPTYASGNKRNFEVVQCPIDDYIPAMVVAMAGFGFVFIRRKDLAI